MARWRLHGYGSSLAIPEFRVAIGFTDRTMQPPIDENLVSTETLRADYYRCSPGKAAQHLVVTFTERCHRDLEGPGFATEFLLSSGCDVVAVKNIVDDWYVGFGSDKLAQIRDLTEGYPNRITYGSSMGAFAAVRFASALNAQTSIAVSPIFDVRQDWDLRFRVDLPFMISLGYDPERPLIEPEDVSPQVTYHVAYDPYCAEDLRHADLLRDWARRLQSVKVPFGGHPVGPALRDAGKLSSFVHDAIFLNDTSSIKLGKLERTDWVRHATVRYLLSRQKLNSALIASTHALAQAPEWSEALLVHAQILERLDRTEEAIPYALKAIEREPKSPYFVSIISEFLIKRRYLSLAKEIVDAGIERMGRIELLTGIRNELEARLRETGRTKWEDRSSLNCESGQEI
jgi:hypothetical protein